LAALKLVLVQLYRVFKLRFDKRKSIQRFKQVVFGDNAKRCVVSGDDSCGASRIRQNRNLSKVLTLVKRTHEYLFLLLVADIHVAVPSRDNVKVRS